MMTREEIASIDRACEEQHISQQEYLDSHGIAKHQYYRWKRKYREEDEQSLVPAGFIPLMPGTTPVQSVPGQRSKGKQQKPKDQESFLTVEIRTSCGSAMRIQGYMTAAHLREIISASNVKSGRWRKVLAVQQASGYAQELQRSERHRYQCDVCKPWER